MTVATEQSYDVEAVRSQFPILQREVRGKPLVYLDSAATAQRPRSVIDAIDRFYTEHNANIHRGVHLLSVEATDIYDEARARVADFIGGKNPSEVVFLRGATEAINLVAAGFAAQELTAGDEILVPVMEHHANIVPWQMAAERTGATVVPIPYREDWHLDLAALEAALSERTKLIAIGHASNVLGTINPVKQIVELAKTHNVPVLVDGCQAPPHLPIDIQDLGADFYAFSGHKVYGPTGIGVLWAKAEWLDRLPPYQGGGDMIESVRFSGTTYQKAPEKFEAGTPNIAGAAGLKAALDFMDDLGPEAAFAHEDALVRYLIERLSSVSGVRIQGPLEGPRVPVVSFTVEGVHPHDLGTILDRYGIAIRAGHHCAQPLMESLGVPATARASLACTSIREEVDVLIDGVEKARMLFA